MKEIIWKWKEDEIKDVKKITYLGYRLKINGGQEADTREISKKVAMVTRQVWGPGKRIFGRG